MKIKTVTSHRHDMKITIRVADAYELAKRFESAPRAALAEVVEQARAGLEDTLERIMRAELELFLGDPAEQTDKRNGFRQRSFTVKGLGSLTLRVPRDRAGRFETKVIPAHRHFDEAIERDLAVLHLAGISTRMLSQLSAPLLGVRVSAMEVSNSLARIVPAAKAFLTRNLADRAFVYLYVDGTNFKVRRSTVDREPRLIVLGVDEQGCKSVLAMVAGDKDNARAWASVFAELKERGLDGSKVVLGIMDGLPGLPDAFREAFPNARVARCWVHKERNVLPRVPRRFQAAFQADCDAIAYAADLEAARTAFVALKATWSRDAGAAVDSLERDLETLLVHYTFPREHWDALRTTNPIERVNKEFKRRSRAMDAVGPDGLDVLLAFTALRLEYGWSTTPITSGRLRRLKWRQDRDAKQLESLTKSLLN